MIIFDEMLPQFHVSDGRHHQIDLLIVPSELMLSRYGAYIELIGSSDRTYKEPLQILYGADTKAMESRYRADVPQMTFPTRHQNCLVSERENDDLGPI